MVNQQVTSTILLIATSFSLVVAVQLNSKYLLSTIVIIITVIAGMQYACKTVGISYPYAGNCEYLGDWIPEHKIHEMSDFRTRSLQSHPNIGWFAWEAEGIFTDNYDYY